MSTSRSKWTSIAVEWKELEEMLTESARNSTCQQRHGFPSNDVYNHINHIISLNLTKTRLKPSALLFALKMTLRQSDHPDLI